MKKKLILNEPVDEDKPRLEPGCPPVLDPVPKTAAAATAAAAAAVAPPKPNAAAIGFNAALILLLYLLFIEIK